MADPRNNPRYSMRTPRSVVTGLGSSGHGFEHFWVIRITAFFGLIFLMLFLGVIFCLIGQPYEVAIKIVGNPFTATIIGITFLSLSIHMKLGMQAIIEDYVRNRPLQLTLLLGNILYCITACFICVAALVRIIGASSGVSM